MPNNGTTPLPHEGRRSPAAPDANDPVGSGLLAEAIEAREVIEQAIVRLAARRRTEADLDRCRAAIAGMRLSREEEALSEFDFALHVALSDAAQNQLLARTFSTMHEPVREMIALFARAAVASGTDALVESHVQLVDAVERGDADAAARIISEMMVILRREAGWHAPPAPDSVRSPSATVSRHAGTDAIHKGDRP